MEQRPKIPGFRPVPRTGVIYVMQRAEAAGYASDGETWINLGQGSPETGPLPGAPERREDLKIDPARQSYAPVDGIVELRQKVADFYNHFYRRGRSSLYTYRNVSIAAGGRAAMTRIAAAMAEVNLGHFIPDYTAYEEILTTFKGFIPIPILLGGAHEHQATAELLEEEIVGRGLSAIWCSNPCNPTGQVISGDNLERWVSVARDNRCTLILDEFYSHYIYPSSQTELGGSNGLPLVSAAAHVEDVERDPVVLIDGLTKNWRYPGWRVSWVVGPRTVIDRVTSAGSFLDGGGNHPFQEAALPLLDFDHAERETRAIQRVFEEKRRFLIERLRSMGIVVESEPQGAFYVWANLKDLPAPLDDGFEFFEKLLAERVITVPGVFFDVNPGKRRANARYHSYTRFSFGPSIDKLTAGLDSVQRVIERHR